MKRRQFVFGILGAATVGLCASRVADYSKDPNLAKLVKVTKTGKALGAEVNLSVFHQDKKRAEKAIREAFEAIERVESTMSLYRSDSQLSRLNRDGLLLDPNPSLVEVLKTARHLSAETGGVFDISIQPLWTAYQAASAKGRLPSEREIQQAKNKVDWKQISVSQKEIRLLKPGMSITLNGIAQGYAADVVGCALRAHDISCALIDCGEINTVGRPPNKSSWKIGIKHPRRNNAILELASLEGRCLATSGDYETHFTDNYEHHHLIDPQSGRSPKEFSSVTVAAPTAMEADAISTAVFLLGMDRGKKLIERLPRVDALFVDKANRTTHTSNFPIA